jgi:hypothetical protein
MKPTFDASLAIAVVTLVPLILIASAFQANSFKGVYNRLRTKTGWRRRINQAFWYTLAFGMLGMCVAAEILALIALRFQTHSYDSVLFGFSIVVTLGLGLSICASAYRALIKGELPHVTLDFVPPASSETERPP